MRSLPRRPRPPNRRASLHNQYRDISYQLGCFIHLRLECRKPHDPRTHSCFPQVLLQALYILALLIVSEGDDIRHSLTDVSDISVPVAENGLVDQCMRRNHVPSLFFGVARSESLYAFCDRVARDRYDEVRLFGKPAGLPEEILVPRVDHIEGTEDHDAG